MWHPLGMEAADLWLIAALVALIISAAVLGAAEAALLRVQRVRLEVAAGSGDTRSATMVSLLDDLPRVLNSVLLVVLLVQIGAATIAGVLSARLFGSLGVTIASFLLTFVLFVYSEAIPKTYAVRHPESVARTTAPLLSVLSWIMRPLVSALVWFADIQAPGTGIASPTAPTEDELLKLASDAVASGTIEPSDHVLMNRAFELGDQRADDIYVPRLDVVAVPHTDTVRNALETAVSSGHRRIPTYQQDIDNIVGVVRLTDLARVVVDDPNQLVSTLTHDPLVVPESRKVLDLLGDMQRAHTHFAVVVDEFGGTAGIVTVEDIAERLVGPMSSERRRGADIEQLDASTWIASGSTDTDDLERAVGISLPSGDWTTVAGLVIAWSGHFPAVGESVESDEVTLTVVEAAGHRILRVSVSVV